MASLLGYLTAQVFTPDRLGIETGAVSMLAVHDVVIAAGFGVLTAGFGIVLMRGVATSTAARTFWYESGSAPPWVVQLWDCSRSFRRK